MFANTRNSCAKDACRFLHLRGQSWSRCMLERLLLAQVDSLHEDRPSGLCLLKPIAVPPGDELWELLGAPRPAELLASTAASIYGLQLRRDDVVFIEHNATQGLQVEIFVSADGQALIIGKAVQEIAGSRAPTSSLWRVGEYQACEASEVVRTCPHAPWDQGIIRVLRYA